MIGFSRYAYGALIAACFYWPATAWGQQADAMAGFHAGPGLSAVDHHFVVETVDAAGGSARENVTQWGIGGQVFAGYDALLVGRVLIGVEGSVDFGGRSASIRLSQTYVGFEPRWGFAATARLGYVVGRNTLLYGGAGYGEHHYRTFASAPELVGDLAKTSSFVLRGGVEHALGRRIGARLEFEHLDGTRNQFVVGLPIRF